MVQVQLERDLGLHTIVELVWAVVQLSESEDRVILSEEVVQSHDRRVFCVDLSGLKLVSELLAYGARDGYPCE